MKQIFKEFLTFCSDSNGIKPELESVFYSKDNQQIVATNAFVLAMLKPSKEIEKDMLINFTTGENNTGFSFPDYTKILPDPAHHLVDTNYKEFLEIIEKASIVKINKQDVYILNFFGTEIKLHKKEFDKIIKLFKALSKIDKNFTIGIHNVHPINKPVYFTTSSIVNALIMPVREE